MGLFSDTCVALVDPSTRKCLSGDRLKEAQAQPKWPRCGASVKKAARFCSTCGAGAPKGWCTCPKCAKWVGNESRACWNCGEPMSPETRPAMQGGRWQRDPTLFAQRFELGDLRALLKEGLVVEEGTSLLLLDGGAFKDVIGPGRHNLDSMARKINWWGDPPPRTGVLVLNGDLVLPLRVEDLRSAEQIPLELYTEVTFRFVERQAKEFIANLLKDAKSLPMEQIARGLAQEIRYAALNVANTSTVEDLLRDPERRIRLEDELQKRLADVLARSGLEIVRVGACEFIGDAFERLMEKAGEIDLKRRELELGMRLRELVSGDRMHALKSEREVEIYLEQLAQERSVGGENRRAEFERVKQVHRHEMDGKEAAYQFARERERVSHELGVKVSWDDYTREKLAKDAEVQRRIRSEDDQSEMESAQRWNQVRAEKERLQREHLLETAKGLQGLDLQTLLAVTDDPGKREQLLELNRRMQASGRTPEHLLAEAAMHSPQAAEALVALAQAQRADAEKRIGENKAMTDEFVARYERLMKDALAANVGVAQSSKGTQQIFKD